MKALVYNGPERLDFQDMPDPVPGARDCLIRIEHVGICGSDMHAWAGHDERRPAPLILGHEAAGLVIEGPLKGQRVTVNPLISCGVCDMCTGGRENLCARREIISMPPRQGAFAELLTMPVGNLVVLPDGFSSQIAALAEPLACGWHAVRLGSRVLDNSIAEASCLVLGGGAIGLGSALVLASQDAAQIWVAETNAARRSIVEQSGPFKVYDPTTETGPDAVDLVVDGVGFEATRKTAFAKVRPGGVISHIGLGSASGGVDVRRATLQEITFIGTYTYTQQDFRNTAQAIFAGALGALDWPEIRPLSDGPSAFADIKTGQAAAPKIILVP
jgi:L-iditol 2-dehydrogenase